MEELKNCPFCGGKAIFLLGGDDEESERCCAVHCDNCGCRTTFCETFDQATQKWNRRAT